MDEAIKDLMLLQPKSITFGQYAISEIQENILTLIIEQLQNAMTTQNFDSIPTDLFGEPYVVIQCDEAGGKNNKALVLKHCDDLCKKQFRYTFKHPKTGKEYDGTGNIITTIWNVRGTNNVMLNFNKWAIPWLLYYGRGVGGTLYSKQIALKLRGDKVKRLYKFICGEANNNGGVYNYDIETFKNNFKIGNSFTNGLIASKILAPAKEKIKNIGSDVNFDYEFTTLRPLNNGRKPKADTIIFRITTKHPQKNTKQAGEHIYIYNMLQWAFGYSGEAGKYFDAIIDRNPDYYRKKLEYYDNLMSAGKMAPEHAKNTIKKICREELK